MRKHVEIEAMPNLNAMLTLICPVLKVTKKRKHAEFITTWLLAVI